MRRRIPRPQAWGGTLSVVRSTPIPQAPPAARVFSSTAVWRFPRAPPRTPKVPSDTPPPSIPFAHSLDEAAVSFLPESSTDDLDPQLRDLQAHLSASFLPTNQRLPAKRSSSSPGSIAALQAARKEKQGEPEGLALVSPFEGGDFYIAQALSRVAKSIAADVQRIDLTLALGFDGKAAPLGRESRRFATKTARSAPKLPDELNPLLQRPTDTDNFQESSLEEDDEESPPKVRLMRVPLTVMAGPMGMPMGEESSSFAPADEQWTQFFLQLIRQPAPTPAADSSKGRKRVILLEATTEMASTFGFWYNSFLEALSLRRADQPFSANPKKVQLISPTTVVLSCATSLLPIHSAAPYGPDRNGAALQTISGASEIFGAVDGGDIENLLGGGEESDVTGRERRDRNRLEMLRDNGSTALLPAFHPRAPQSTGLMALLHGLRSNHARPGNITKTVLPILASDRDQSSEELWRKTRRKALNTALLTRALSMLASDFSLDLANSICEDNISMWSHYEHLAARAACLAAENQPVDWSIVQQAISADKAARQTFSQALEQHLPTATLPGTSPTQPKENLIESIKASKFISSHEKRLLSCVVDSRKLDRTSFNDVILPDKTIDAIRTVVSLPLLHPQAFRTGILKDNATQGALFFGPPGTGKTMLARAVASESGARMISVQPSDINSMYVGEGEKAVKSLFNLAKKLAPCVVFVDECDVLFSSRMSKDAGGGGRAHNAIVSTFLEEMDGLQSLESREKGIIVIGATNRPFDIDEAALRRLPRRLLIDLPDANGRLSILKGLLSTETLDPDADLHQLVQRTDGYSGSDLKHVCVNAALCAIKETVHLPWKGAASGPAESGSSDRILKWKHFESALKDIRGSASEESLPEMRKWAAAFGEGFSHRRNGFGKTFGFSELSEKSSLGRVSEENA